MRIKKFIASNMQEGKALIERELGTEAIILSNRKTKTKTGIDAIELVAALDNDNHIKENNKPNPFVKSKLLNPLISSDGMNNEINKKLITEISSLKNMLNELSDNVKYKYTGTMPQALARIYKIMINSDFSENTALDIIGKINEKGITNDYNQAINEARKIILNDINYANPIQNMQNNAKQIISFIGSTGSGKTSALIKLAIVSKLLYKAKVLIVSIDTSKVGGAEQLQTLASIAGINYITAYSPKELSNIIKEEKKYDMIFIDTFGINPNNKEDVSKIIEFQYEIKPTQTLLVLNATSSEQTLNNNINKLKDVEPTSIIITRVDEAIGLGNIISVINKNKIPVSYFAYGQKIPDDIEPANSDKLNDYLFVV